VVAIRGDRCIGYRDFVRSAIALEELSQSG